MTHRIVVLTGKIGAGKSALRSGLEARYNAASFRTRDEISRLAEAPNPTRAALQRFGERLDVETNGEWLATALKRLPSWSDLLVVDSARTLAQVEAIRHAFPRSVTHVHLTAPSEELASRYALRSDEEASFETASADSTESAVDSLRHVCDVLIDTVSSTSQDVLVRAAARIGLYKAVEGAYVDVLIGAQWGSEGKGHVAWYLAPEYDVLVRVGGPNAGHKVIDPKYTFRLLPSGTGINPRARLFIGAGATIDPELLLKEIADCGVGEDRLSIDPQAVIIEPSDIAFENRSLSAIGSTKKGGGYAAARRLMRDSLGDEPVRFAFQVETLKRFVRPLHEELDDAYRRGDRILLEGTQGSGLSLYHGPYPHVTSRDTTASGTLAEAGIAPSRVRRVILVTRTYPIRVANPVGEGTSGPMNLETSWADVAARSGLAEADLVSTERTSVSNVLRRVGLFDWTWFRKACSLNAPTDIALTFSDYLSVKNVEARRFEQLTQPTLRFIEEVERVSNAPVSLVSTRFHERSVLDRRTW